VTSLLYARPEIHVGVHSKKIIRKPMNDNDQEQFRVVHDQIGKVHGKMKENIELAVQRYVFHIYCRIIPHL
jgi:hypothetical protein